MKRYLLLLALLPLAGCKTVTTTQPLAPGYQNATDQQMGEILSGARAFYNTIQCETQGMNWSKLTQVCVPDPNITAPMVLTPTVKAAFNDFGTALNAANTVYLGYHAGSQTEAAAQSAVNTVQTKQAALPIPGAN